MGLRCSPSVNRLRTLPASSNTRGRSRRSWVQARSLRHEESRHSPSPGAGSASCLVASPLMSPLYLAPFASRLLADCRGEIGTARHAR